jgi:hypothetical protein
MKAVSGVGIRCRWLIMDTVFAIIPWICKDTVNGLGEH